MGYGNVGNFSVAFIKRIYAKGSASIKDCVDVFLKKQERTKNEKKKQQYGYSASEGMYYEEEMLASGFSTVAYFHRKNGIIEPSIDIFGDLDAQHRVLENWEDSTDADIEVLDTIQWQFAKGGRKKYLDKKIDHVDRVSS